MGRSRRDLGAIWRRLTFEVTGRPDSEFAATIFAATVASFTFCRSLRAPLSGSTLDATPVEEPEGEPLSPPHCDTPPAAAALDMGETGDSAEAVVLGERGRIRSSDARAASGATSEAACTSLRTR